MSCCAGTICVTASDLSVKENAWFAPCYAAGKIPALREALEGKGLRDWAHCFALGHNLLGHELMRYSLHWWHCEGISQQQLLICSMSNMSNFTAKLSVMPVEPAEFP